MAFLEVARATCSPGLLSRFSCWAGAAWRTLESSACMPVERRTCLRSAGEKYLQGGTLESNVKLGRSAQSAVGSMTRGFKWRAVTVHSELGGTVQEPLLNQTRGCLEEVKSLDRGDLHISRGCRDRALGPPCWANRYNVSSRPGRVFGGSRTRTGRGSTACRMCARGVRSQIA